MSLRGLKIEIPAEKAGLRLDHFLADRYPQFSRAYLQKQILERNILLNQHPARKGDLLRAGDCLEIKELLEVSERHPIANLMLPIRICYEDKDLAVIDKPAGIPTHPVHHEETHTVVNWWLAKNPNLLSLFPDPLRPGIVHRLDTNTSGLLILARNLRTLERLQEQFRERTVKKEYLALVLGNPPAEGTIDYPLAHHPKNRRKMMAVLDSSLVDKLKARNARSEFHTIKNYPGFSLLCVHTLTGRMHQVRVHLAALGHPLVGDVLYQKRRDSQRTPFSTTRHFLHATSLAFTHPHTQERLKFCSELPEDLQIMLRAIGS